MRPERPRSWSVLAGLLPRSDRIVRVAQAVCLAIAACSSPIPLRLDAPVRSGDVSMIAAIFLPGGVELHAIDLTGARAKLGVSSAYDGTQSADVFVFLYREPLSDLALTEGPIALAGTNERSRPIPAAPAIFSAHVTGDRASEWTAAGATDPRLTALRIPSASRCATFETTPLSLPSGGGAQFTVRVAGYDALVGTSTGGLFLVTPEGDLKPLAISPPEFLAGAFQMNPVVPQDTLMFGGANGRLFIGTVHPNELTLTSVSTSTSNEELKTVAGQGSAAGTSAFTLSRMGVFEYFDRRDWHRLYDFGTGLSEGGLAYLSRDEAYAGWANTPFLVHYKDGAATEERIGDASFRVGVRTMIHIASIGTLLGTVDGKIFLQDGSGWRNLPGSPLTAAVQSIAPYEDGFVAGSIGGNFVQFVDGEFCPLLQPTTAQNEFMVVLGDVVLVGHTGDMPDHTEISLLRPAR